jgi:hypothetical protein
MGFFRKVQIWCDKYELRCCTSFESIPRIQEITSKYKGAAEFGEIAELAFSKLLSIKMGHTAEDRLTYAQAVSGFHEGAARAVVQLLTRQGDKNSTLQLSVLADYCPKMAGDIIRTVSQRTDEGVPEVLGSLCQGSARTELKEAYQAAFVALYRRGTPEALDVAAEIFYKNAALLQAPLCKFVTTRLNHGVLDPQAVTLLKVLTDPEKLVPCLESSPRTKYSLGLVFNSLEEILKNGGCSSVDLQSIFGVASQEAEAPAKTAATWERVFSRS